MTAGWTGTSMAAGDTAWHAWHRLGVDGFRLAFDESTAPPMLEELAATIAPAVATVTRAVLDELEVRLYGEARERVVATAQHDMLTHTAWAVVEAVRRELMRPEPEPYAPPPAGAWIRSRWLPRPAVRRLKAHPEPSWDGLWHRFTGDVAVPGRGHRRINDRIGRVRCGISVTLRDDLLGQDLVVAETMPAVDACRRCARSVATGGSNARENRRPRPDSMPPS